MLLISEAFISPFKFWGDGQIQQGMRFRNQLFRAVGCFEAKQRQQAFDLSHSFVQAGQEVVITTAQSRYTIWVGLIPGLLLSAPNQSPDCSTQPTIASNWNRLTQSVNL